MKVYIVETKENDSWKLSSELFPLVYYAETEEDVNYEDLERDENGKPMQYNGHHFSISHSGRFWVCAFSSTSCGIDIEERRAVDVRLADRVLAPGEDETSLDSILTAWVLKESYAKLTGEASNLDYSSISMDWLKQNFIVTDFSTDDYICYAIGREAMGETIYLHWDGQELTA